MNGVWRKLCPQLVSDFDGLEDIADQVIVNIVDLSKEIDLCVEVDDVTELLESHGEELSAGDLIQLEKQIIEQEKISTPEPKAFTRRGLSKDFAGIQKALAIFEAEDPNMERFARVSGGIMDLLQCYKEILDEKKCCLSSLTWSSILRKWRDLNPLHQLPLLLQSLYHLPQLPLLPQLLYHLINTVLYYVCFYSCDKELFSVFLI